LAQASSTRNPNFGPGLLWRKALLWPLTLLPVRREMIGGCRFWHHEYFIK
jgi:hypothetical protein